MSKPHVTIEEVKEDLRYLRLLARDFPTVSSVSTEIINLEAILHLPKPTEHFLADIHGEHEAFQHILRNASGTIKRKVNDLFGNTITEDGTVSRGVCDVENGYLNSRITLADAMLARKEGTYTPATRAALETACTDAKTVATNKDATVEQIAAAAAALAEKITTIRVAANKTPLNESITKANAALEGKTAADFEEKYFTPFSTAHFL